MGSSSREGRMRGSERRALILAQAKKVFAQQGYTLASMGELARASDVTEAMLYKHFESKKHLYLTVLEEVATQFQSAFYERVTEKANHDLAGALSSLVLDYRAVGLSYPESLRILLSDGLESTDPIVIQFVQAHCTHISTLIHDLLTEAQNQGILPLHLDLKAASWGYISLLFGIQQRAELKLFDQISVHTLVEMNRLWFEALKIG